MLSGSTLWATGRMMLVLAGLFAVVVYASRRGANGPRASRRTIRLGGAHELHVVEVDGQRLLVGTGPGSAPSLLRVLDGEGEAAAHAGGSNLEFDRGGRA